jgi:hypothetical protein
MSLFEVRGLPYLLIKEQELLEAAFSQLKKIKF